LYTIGLATKSTVDANAMVTGGCCNSRADVECKVVYTW